MYKAHLYCLIIMAVISLIFATSQKEWNKPNRIYAILLIVSMVHLCLDATTVYTVNHLETVNPVFNRVVHQFFLSSMLVVFYLGYIYLRTLVEIDLHRPVSGWGRWVSLPVLLGCLGVFTLELYYVETDKGNYSYGPAVLTLYVSIVFYIVVILWLLMKYHSYISIKKMKAISIALTVEIILAIYQHFNPTALVSGLGITVVCFGFYLTVENPDAVLVDLLKEATLKADAANNAKTNFLANMSHEIRTPINAILGMNRMIQRESNQEEIRDYASEINRATKSLLGIINDILDITKIEAGKMTIVPVEYHLQTLLGDVYNMLKFKADEKNLDLQIEAVGDLPSVIIGDDIRVRQILVNLMNNAIKYTHEGRVILLVEKMEGDNIRFCVKDTGIGIRKEDIDKLYVPFERIEEKRNRNIEGAGLGLNITMQLLSMMGSRLEVHSVYGEGSEFSFILSQKTVDATPFNISEIGTIKAENQDIYTASFIAPDARVLVVDDNALNRKVFRRLLKDTKIQVDEADCGMKCLELIQSIHYDIIFMDHMMPEMDGIQTFTKMKQTRHLCQDTPVVVLTANAIVGAKEEYMKYGFESYMSKPVEPDLMEKKIYELLDPKLVKKQDKQSVAGQKKTEFPILEGFDWNYARTHFKNEEDLVDTIGMFAKMIQPDASELDGYFANIELPDARDLYRVKIHSMKNMASMIGNIQIAGLAMMVEDAVRHDHIDDVKTMHPIFLHKWLQCKEQLICFQQDTGDKMNGTDHMDELAHIFEQIRNAARELDIDMLDEAAKKLDGYYFDEEYGNRMEQIKLDILNFETDKLLDLKVPDMTASKE